MRNQAVNHKKRIEKHSQEAVNRTAAMQLLREGRGIRAVSRMTAVSRTTVGRIQKAIKTNCAKLNDIKKRWRAEEHQRREIERKKRRLDVARRKLERQSAAQRKRREAETRKYAQELGRKVVLTAREVSCKDRRTSVRGVDLAAETGLGEGE
ncbi:hypothetical protein FGB62_202g00 [Gracilaria domingensis]|nr:hypothetical protein FGB62_202g00 [Gracilaria domingensis]